ncbi:uncharacterized protein LOC105701501 isoform X2 [Orussus abietinus]|nr:uncharacterized protein LOC105701501 isoform X2 [Orussus abietinus]XP_023289406.1 uncharacterized protein LOC105701501 isoform X2 [Orussus abietinus]XP_023289407.1 uncharacterized protein LOC105701501 isoform X2 [Orussus abietinus]XP_023289408.1 uncharacterized protein LOC105701501 isoform X2 [Orussus abietinus]XP_023289409.1 uncharacterized protein LOC105701501 isoform X2 [Orussus abietinus]
MPLYYSGLNASALFLTDDEPVVIVDGFKEIPFKGLTSFGIGWNYFLLWKESELYITGKLNVNDICIEEQPRLLKIPEKAQDCKEAAVGRESIMIVSTSNDIWQYKIYDNVWRKIASFIPRNDDSDEEHVVKIVQGGCTVALTNLGK